MRGRARGLVGCGLGLLMGWFCWPQAARAEKPASLPFEPQTLEQGTAAVPPEARAVVEELRRTEAQVWARAEAELAPARAAAVRKLQALQDEHTRAGHLDEAVAIRELVREVLGIRPDPGLLRLEQSDVGRVYLYEVSGSLQGSVWGSEVYTSDSHLGTAAVHAGALAPGQKGLVRVRVLGAQKSFRGSSSNGVTSLGYGPWHISFTLEPVRLER